MGSPPALLVPLDQLTYAISELKNLLPDRRHVDLARFGDAAWPVRRFLRRSIAAVFLLPGLGVCGALRFVLPAIIETRVQGRVSLVCVVGKAGKVKSVEVKAGHPLLVKAATEAVSQWKFKPLLLNGEAVEFEAPVNVDFQLPKVQKDPALAKPTA